MLLRISTTLIISLFSFLTFSQSSFNPWNAGSLQAAENQAETYFAGYSPQSGIKDNEWIHWKRWQWYWQHRLMPDGSFPNPEYVREQQQLGRTLKGAHKKRGGNWVNINQRVSESGYNGMGRLEAVAFHPTDSNQFYVGTQAGGIWKTTNNGQSWMALGELLPFCSAGNIVVDHQNPSTLYITIGRNDYWSDYGLGVYKSTDGGQTWQATNQSGPFSAGVVYFRLLMHPGNSQILYSAQNNGLFRTVDGGINWTQLFAGEITDLKFKPGLPEVMYLVKNSNSGSTEIFRSTDSGLNWVQKTNLATSANLVELAVTPHSPNTVYFVTDNGTKELYRSNDSLETYTLVNSALTNNPIFASPTNGNRIYEGFTSIYRSVDGGLNFSQLTHWYNDGVHSTVHADQRQIEFNPLTPQYIYFCNDGGLYRLHEPSGNWQDLSDGLIITQYYKIAVSQTDSVFMIGGTQDNGGRKRIAYPDQWDATNGGDGMEVAKHPQNELTMYTTYWGGTLYRSYDQWDQDTYYEITPDTAKAAWVTPYQLDPLNPYRLIAGYADVWQSLDEGDNWTKLSNNLTGSYNNKLEVLDVARANTQVIYTGRKNNFWVTQNNGNTWTPRSIPTSSGSFENLSCVLSHPTQAQQVYITKGGFSDGSKVFRSINAGQSWNNISYNLPNVPVNCIQIDMQSDSNNVDIYLGTDAGVYYKKELDTLWQYYGSGLPNTEVTDLEIQYATFKLRAGTYGRGVWEIPLERKAIAVGIPPSSQVIPTIRLLQNPVGQTLNLSIEASVYQNCTYQIVNIHGQQIQEGQLEIKGGKQVENIALKNCQAGIYLLILKNDSFQTSLKFKCH